MGCMLCDTTENSLVFSRGSGWLRTVCRSATTGKENQKKSELIVALKLCITHDIVANCRCLFALAFSVAQNDTTPAISIKIVEGAL